MIIKGNTVGTTMPRTDYEQTDPTKSDYLKGKDILDQKIGDAKAAADSKLSMELLWVNDSPTSSFAPHTISIDLSAYVGVLVMMKLDAGTDTLTSEYGQKGKTHRASVSRLNTIDSKNYLGFARKFTVSDDGVAFDYGTANTTSSTTNLSTSMIPVYIYGIKGGASA